MVEENMSAYYVAYERDYESGWWVASVREVRGCHTQGRTVDEARRRIRKAMDLFVDDARSAKLVDNVKLPAPASKAIRLTPRCASNPIGKTSVRLSQRGALSDLLARREAEIECRDAARLLGSAPASSSTWFTMQAGIAYRGRSYKDPGGNSAIGLFTEVGAGVETHP